MKKILYFIQLYEMTDVTIQKQICLEPQFLDEKISKHLYAKICGMMLNQCDQTYGYVLEIDDNIKILGNTISSAGSGIFFNVQFKAKTMKPVVGESYDGVVFKVFSYGIFVLVGKMKILVSTDKMGGFTYEKTKNVFAKGPKSVTNGTKVRVRIETIRYERQNFSCIGSLKTLIS